MAAQLAARVVQGLVERAAGRAQALGEHVDRDSVQREGDEHTPLVRRQYLADRLLQRVEELALLGRFARLDRGAREQAPGLGLERYLTALPGPPAQLYRGLEQSELVRPRREAAGAAKAVQSRQDGDERVVGRLVGDVVEVVAAQMRESRPAAGAFEARGAQEELVEA